jgi:transposase
MKPTYEQLETELAETKQKLDKTAELLKFALQKIAELEEKLNLNSGNSSKPPSTDQKSNTLDKGKKKRPPREGKSRVPFSKDRVDKQVTCERKCCAHCGSESLELLTGLAEFLQQVELPVVRAIVTEYILHKYKCSSCGEQSTADLPAGVPNTVFGPSVMALFSTLTGLFHLAKREAIQLIKELYDVDISLGSSSNIEERVADALNPVCVRIHRFILDGPFCRHCDETGWRTDGKRRYVWVLSCEKAAYYQVDPNRSREAFERMIGKPTDELDRVVTDRYGVYGVIDGLHQHCLAHIIRDFKRYAERKGPDGPIGQALAKELAKACNTHGEYRDGTITKKQRNLRLGHAKRHVEYWLDDGFANGSDKLSSLCDNVINGFHKLWTFTKVDGMEPTNNLAERDLRKLVIWRRKSYGTRSDRGERFVARITTVAETLKRHGMSVLRYIEKVLRCAYRGEAPPQISPALGF